MLNFALGSPAEISGTPAIATRKDARGHAIYGPYETVEPGSYVVEFLVEPLTALPQDRDLVCGMVDVTAAGGTRQIASHFVLSSHLDGLGPIAIAFTLAEPCELEYRFHVNGEIPLRIADTQRLVRLADGAPAPASRSTEAIAPDLLADRRWALNSLYEHGVQIGRIGGERVMRLQGLTFNAHCYDDVNFVDELFFKSAYNFQTTAETCVIDVGMNVGLASLLFAAQPSVKEVHAFEPFPATYERALANLRLNPALAAKIKANNIGLSDRDETSTFLIPETSDSGGQATRSVEGGVPVDLALRDAAAALRPIIASAKARGLQVIAKIDCEGAEFALFESLARAGLLEEIHAFMVEWHRVFPGRTQQELIQPLLDRGFIAIDLTPPTGNGFFYAARIQPHEVQASQPWWRSRRAAA